MEEKKIISTEAIFSEELLRFLFSIIKANDPFGLFWESTDLCDGQSIFEIAFKEGNEKGILKGEELTEKGLAYLRILEEYEKAHHYCMVNKVIAAVLPKEMLIAFYLDGETYQMKVITVKQFLGSIFIDYPELLEREVEVKKGLSQKKKLADWLEEHKEYQGKMVMTGSYQKEGSEREEIFYWNESGTFRYQLQKEREKEVDKELIVKRFQQICTILEE